MRRRSLLSVVVASVVLFSACGLSASVPDPATTTLAPSATTLSNVGGDRLPVQSPDEDYGHFPTPLTGRAALESNGCWQIDLGDGPRLLIFPQDFVKPASDGSLMEAPDGVRVSNGMNLDAAGGLVQSVSLPGGPDGYWGSYLEFCRPARPEVVVLDWLEPAFEPEQMDTPTLIAMMGNAELTTSWPCGLGFAVSSADQRVSISVHSHESSSSALSVPVDLPDPSWTANLRVGKNLMADNCDDVVEGWEPRAVVAATWEITGGVLDFIPPEGEGCGGSGPVEAVLKEAVVSTPTGEVALDTLTMVNDAFGCFAG